MRPVVRMFVFGTVAVAVVLVAAVALACVPQRGKLEVENNDNPTEVNASSASGVSDWIAGDGDPNTRHFSSWCGDEGGHPVEAVWAESTHTLNVTVEKVNKGAVSGGGQDPCPVATNKLPEGEQFIYLGHEDSDPFGEDAYVWDETNNPGGHYPDGFWNFNAGDARGCYPPDRGAQELARITIGSNGSGNNSNVPLDQAQTTNTFTGSPGSPNPGDDASVLCVGEDIDLGPDAVAIFAPVVITEV